MKASETTLQPVIEGTKQYIVPLFQRSYSWEKKQWQTLWEDLVELAEADNSRSHFIGSIVTMQTTSVPEGVPKYLLIDGQQRLTTLFLLICLLRDHAKRNGQDEVAEEIGNTFLVNQYKKGDDYFKILPTQVDRPSFQRLIRSAGQASDDRIGRAYAFFEKQLRQGGPDVAALKKVITERLSVVSITLDRDDNPYLVFESLNAKGERLTQADLIRNFFFLKVHAEKQEQMHSQLWLPMQDALGDSLTEFIRHYLMKKGEFVRTDSIYFELKEHLGQDDPLTLLQALSRAAVSYKKLLEPAYEPDRKIRLALERLGRLDVTTAYPFLLNCYEEYDRGMLSPTDFSEIIAHLENFIVRRFVCNVPTSQLNKIFAALYNQIQSGGHATLLEGVRRVLSTKGYPKDIDFKERLKGARLYGPGERLEKTRFILESIERSFGHKEKVDLDGLTIEHVMPQTLTDSWRVHLGDDWQANYELLLHTLGNLTLTGYNPELSNEDFAAKKKHLAQKSHVQMNQFFADCERWDANEIERRAEFLATAAIGIWPYFGGEQEEVIAVTAAPGKPKVLRFLNQEYPVKTWRDVLATTLKVIIERDPQAIEGLLSDFPTLLSRQKEKLRVTREFADGLFVYVDLSAKNVNLWCQRFLEAAEIDRDAWSVEIG